MNDKPLTRADLAEIEDSISVIIEMLTLQPGGPWHWGKLHPEAQELLWNQLFDWVSFLEERYLRHLDRETFALPACWYRHDVAVELLTALMVAHQAVYQEAATIASSALVDWHERCLFPTMARLRELKVLEPCQRAKKHEPTQERATVIDRAEFEAFRAEAAAAASAADAG